PPAMAQDDDDVCGAPAPTLQRRAGTGQKIARRHIAAAGTAGPVRLSHDHQPPDARASQAEPRKRRSNYYTLRSSWPAPVDAALICATPGIALRLNGTPGSGSSLPTRCAAVCAS